MVISSPIQSNIYLQTFIRLDNCNDLTILKDSLILEQDNQLNISNDAIKFLIQKDSVNMAILSLLEQKQVIDDRLCKDEIKRQKQRVRKARLMGVTIAPPLVIIGFLVGYFLK